MVSDTPEARDGRRARSARTRRRITEAAQTAFREHGYVNATVESIAAGAGVSAQTVYTLFGSKPKLLSAVLDTSIVGDHVDVPLAGRDWIEQLDAITEPAAAAEHIAAGVTALLERTTPIYDVVCRAADDPEINRLLVENRRRRFDDQRMLIETLDRNRLLRTGLDVDTAVDTFYAIVNEETYMMLVVDRGWTVRRFSAWVADVIRRQLTR